MIRRLLLALLLPWGVVHADDPDAVLGYWATRDSILQVARAGDGLSMRVVALENPVYLEDEPQGPPGAPRVDASNPDPALRQRPILGLELLSEYEFARKRWRGRIYDPQSGNVYSSTMWVEDGELHMRGYIGVALFGRTQAFAPVAGCSEGVRTLLEATGFDGASCD